MIVGVIKETFPGERRVALVPGVLPAVIGLGADVLVETNAGIEAAFTDESYVEKGARIAGSRAEVFRDSDIVCMIRTSAANLQVGTGVGTGGGTDDTELYRADQVLIGLSEPLTALEPMTKIAATGARTFALELIPRITRGQAMDVLSSQATIAGYKAVSLAIDTLPKLFPMMMTAAGTIAPAKVFVIGAGVAGLQAIASSRRAGAVVSAFDVRPEVREQVESLGGKFVQIEVATAEGEGGYAREQTEDERRQQQALMADVVADSDVVITTAAVPGKKAPMLIPADVARRMRPGSSIIDMAAERGGNCELTKPDEIVVENGVSIFGPTNMAATIPTDASRMFAKNVANLLALIVKDGQLVIDMEDEIISGTLATDGGEIVHAFAREVFGLPPLATAAAAEPPVAAETPEGEGN